MSSSAITRSGGCSLKGCKVFSPARTIRRCQCRVTPNISAARSRISSDSGCSPTPGRIIARRSISSKSRAALSWASRSRATRTSSGASTLPMLTGRLEMCRSPCRPTRRRATPRTSPKSAPGSSAPTPRRTTKAPGSSTTTWPTSRPPTATTACTGSTSPRPAVAPAHFHRAMSEAFFVLSGTMRLYDGTEWVDGHQGDFLYVPPGGIHGFRNEADEPASILMLFAPGAPREAYFEGFGALADMTDDERTRVVHPPRQLLGLSRQVTSDVVLQVGGDRRDRLFVGHRRDGLDLPDITHQREAHHL